MKLTIIGPNSVTYTVSILSVGVWLEGKNRIFFIPTEKIKTVPLQHLVEVCILLARIVQLSDAPLQCAADNPL